jgi:hypothetical protein
MTTGENDLSDSKATANGHPKARHIPTTPLEHRSLGELVATLSRDLALLVHQEIELVKSDMVSGLRKVALGAVGLVVAGALVLLAVPVLSVALALGIHALGVSLGWSFLIVAGGYLVLAAGAAAIGLVTLRKPKPPNRAVASVKADLQAIARKPTPTHNR